MRILNRIAEWRPDGSRYEADRRLAEEVARALGPAEGKVAVTPAVRETECRAEDNGDNGAFGARQFRGLAAKLNFAAQNRQGTQYAAKEVCRATSQAEALGAGTTWGAAHVAVVHVSERAKRRNCSRGHRLRRV